MRASGPHHRPISGATSLITPSPCGSLKRGSASSASIVLSGVVNVNVASIEELTMLPGVGETRAKAIIAWREHKEVAA